MEKFNNLIDLMLCAELSKPEYANLTDAQVVAILNKCETYAIETNTNNVVLSKLRPFEVLQRAGIAIQDINKILDDLHGSIHYDSFQHLKIINPDTLNSSHWVGVFDYWRVKKFISKKQRENLKTVFNETVVTTQKQRSKPKISFITNDKLVFIRVSDVNRIRKIM